MNSQVNRWLRYWQRLVRTSLVGILLICLSVSLSGALAQGNAITDPTAILRYALPIENNTVRLLQESVEDIANHLRAKRWGPINRDISTASRTLSIRQKKLLETVPQEQQAEAEALIAQMRDEVETLREAAQAKDKEQVWNIRRGILDRITTLEEMMVTDFPFTVPEKYSYLPQLKGRATVEMETTQGNLTIVVDGYSAPINAGNFVDLVQRGFYDGLEFIRAEDFYILQTGDPPGPEEGFIDPDTGEYRAIPLEVLVEGESEPIYEITLEDAGIYLDPPVLPFNAYGAVALARPEDDTNGGSSQFFFFKFDTELTPPGFNLMDGRYSVFGYVVEGKEVLEKLTQDDRIISAKVVQGLDNLVEPQS